ncbi:LysR family transcriptional regulator [Paracoccus methylovorus]|uniref:LysR family transcriptional regulator n=1 Tax=Paracoccus methylovorus TaxID=2812658 RepID=A0ABX7JF34_9RHOB|nr:MULTISPECIES: LysR family transcriptional regulator [Paracoccus]MDQ7775629.1 LysR family transcriptional regulator [Paracoccus aminovorans]QRZ12835.1 LysR family transcriptional regulator [Paracoccus methylovorus]
MPDRPDIPLNALRTFEVAARQGSFTRAAIELRVTQAAVSHQIARLEDTLGATLFRRTPNGLVMTDAGKELFPVMERGLNDIARMLDRVTGGQRAEVLSLGVVTTFATGWLIPRLKNLRRDHPEITLRLSTNNNRVEIVREGLDAAIRFGSGRWPGLEAHHILDAPMGPLCAPHLDLRSPSDLRRHTLLRSYRADEWPKWFAEAGETCPPLTGPVLDSSVAMADIAAEGLGIALLPLPMFERDQAAGRLVRPFPASVTLGGYWLTIPEDRRMTPATDLLLSWIRAQVA